MRRFEADRDYLLGMYCGIESLSIFRGLQDYLLEVNTVGLEVNTVELKKLVLLAGVSTASRSINWYQSCLPGNSDGVFRRAVSFPYVKKYPDNTPWEHFEIEVVKRGLKLEVRTPMRMFQANTISEAYQLARMQEATNTILKPRYNTPLLPTPKQSTTTTTYASKAMTTPTKTNSIGQNSRYVTRNWGNEGMMKQAELSSMDLCVYPAQLCQMESVGIVSAEVEKVLTQFAEVFEIPKDLPPQRSHDALSRVDSSGELLQIIVSSVVTPPKSGSSGMVTMGCYVIVQQTRYRKRP
nr:gypsy/Ty3 retroelement polyprotein [Tanacetum cinerariifolium]